MSSQHYAMTAANELLDLLSQILEQLKNSQSGKGMSKGQSKSEINLPDLIREMKKVNEKMSGNVKKQNEGKMSKEELSGELFRIYQKQQALKMELKKMLDGLQKPGKAEQQLLKDMDNVEKMLLDKGFTQENLERMKALEYELLELEDALKKQNSSNQRTSEQAKELLRGDTINDIELKRFSIDFEELLRREKIEMWKPYRE